MAGEPLKARDSERDQILFCSRPQIAHGRVNSASPAGDFHVVESRRPQFLFFGPWPAENGVRVGIDESWHEHAAPAIDRSGPRITRLELGPRAYVSDATADNRDAAVGADARVPHFFATTRPCRAGTCHNLRGVGEE